MLLQYLWLIGSCIYSLQLPDTTSLSGESKGYAGGFLILSLLPALLSAIGLAGSLLVLKKRLAAGILMIVSGTLIVLFPGSSIAFPFMFGGQVPVQLSFIPPLMVLAAGVLSLISGSKAPDKASGPAGV